MELFVLGLVYGKLHAFNHEFSNVLKEGFNKSHEKVSDFACNDVL